MLVKTSRWLKKPLYTLLALFFIYMGAYATLYRVSDYASLKQQADWHFANSSRHITFDENIGRRLLPRPTVILKNVVLTETNSQNPALRVDELRVGIAWQSLWQQQPEIEKLVLDDLSGNLKLNANGQWNIADVWQNTQPNTQSLRINRLIINDGRITLNAAEQEWLFQNIDFTSQRNGNSHAYRISAQVQHPQWDELNLHAQGQAHHNPNQWHLPNAVVQFTGKENGYDFSGSLKSQITWQTGHFDAKQTQLEISNKRFNTHINTNAERIESTRSNTKITGINSTYSFHYGQEDYTGTLNAPQAAWVNHILSSDDLSIAISSQSNPERKFNLTLHGSGHWQNQAGLRLPQVKMTSLQTMAQNQTRFASEWEGSVHLSHYNAWNIQAQGLFDRQPAVLSLSRAGDLVRGNISLNKLDLSNYLEENDFSQFQYPTFPETNLQFQIGINLGVLKLPHLEINNLHSQIQANAQNIVLNPLTAELYGGQSHTTLRIQNSLPPTFELKQTSKGVHVQPLMQDLFRMNRIDGQGHTELDLKTQGTHRQELIANLSGSLKMNVQNGQWLGINFAQLFKSAFGSESGYNDADTQKNTPFTQFSLESQIQQGISRHSLTAQLSHPIALLTSEGQTNFNTGELRDDILIETASAPALPIRLSGKLDDPSISLNYQKITSGSQNTQDKHKIISDTLKQQWQWLRQEHK